jgi:hypothetical protein
MVFDMEMDDPKTGPYTYNTPVQPYEIKVKKEPPEGEERLIHTIATESCCACRAEPTEAADSMFFGLFNSCGVPWL